MEVQGEQSSGASKAVVGREEYTPLPVRRRCPLFEASMISASSTDSDLRGEVREGHKRGAILAKKVGTVRAFEVQRWSLRHTLRRRRRWTPDLCSCFGGGGVCVACVRICAHVMMVGWMDGSERAAISRTMQHISATRPGQSSILCGLWHPGRGRNVKLHNRVETHRWF